MQAIKKLGSKIIERLKGRSMLMVKTIVLLSIVPICLLVLTWCYIWVTHDTSTWAQTMLDQLMKIVDRITAPSVVAAFIAYAAKLVDKDGNGVPDDFERKDDTNVHS